jgi:hypothetical protein
VGYREVFACPVEFEQAFSGVLLANAVLDAPSAAGRCTTGADAPPIRPARWRPCPPAPNFGAPAARLDRAGCRGLPDAGAGGAALGLSERTLARRMQAQGLSFSALLDEAPARRRPAAVAHTDRALGDIGQSLGFAEPSTFWRAFRRWTGGTPQAWRSQAQA